MGTRRHLFGGSSRSLLQTARLRLQIVPVISARAMTGRRRRARAELQYSQTLLTSGRSGRATGAVGRTERRRWCFATHVMPAGTSTACPRLCRQFQMGIGSVRSVRLDTGQAALSLMRQARRQLVTGCARKVLASGFGTPCCGHRQRGTSIALRYRRGGAAASWARWRQNDSACPWRGSVLAALRRRRCEEIEAGYGAAPVCCGCYVWSEQFNVEASSRLARGLIVNATAPAVLSFGPMAHIAHHGGALETFPTACLRVRNLQSIPSPSRFAPGRTAMPACRNLCPMRD
mmetsp:Transcript_36623/g.76479  ORF Transcript_36623/g.76479 Transcript_36623/m.76479 type:complete len:289 (+) Transcript_36623:653-1519(+)